MRKVAAIAVVLVLGVAILLERGLSDEPAINADAATAVASSGGLAALGPVELVSHPYNASVTGNCGSSGEFFSVTFTAAAFGSAGIINTVDPVIEVGFIAFVGSGGVVFVSGPVPAGSCGTGLVIQTVSGLIDGVDGYVMSIEV